MSRGVALLSSYAFPKRTKRTGDRAKKEQPTWVCKASRAKKGILLRIKVIYIYTKGRKMCLSQSIRDGLDIPDTFPHILLNPDSRMQSFRVRFTRVISTIKRLDRKSFDPSSLSSTISRLPSRAPYMDIAWGEGREQKERKVQI